MKTKAALLILALCMLLSACVSTGAEADFSLKAYGEVFPSENAIFCIGNDDISVYSPGGEILTSVQKIGDDPMYDAHGNWAVICAENEIFISDGREIRHNTYKNKIMSTTINNNGYVALCTEEAGYKGSVTVCDEKLTPIYKWYSASGFIIKAVLSEKNTLAVLTANEKGSTVHVFKLSSEKEQYSVFIEKKLAIDLCWMEGKLCILTESAAYFAKEDDIKDTVIFDRPLGGYVLSGELVLLEMQNGDGTSEILSYNKNGGKNGSADLEMLQNAAVSGDRIAVISSGEALLFDEDLRELCRADAKGARSAFICSGKMMLLYGSEIKIVNK